MSSRDVGHSQTLGFGFQPEEEGVVRGGDLTVGLRRTDCNFKVRVCLKSMSETEQE